MRIELMKRAMGAYLTVKLLTACAAADPSTENVRQVGVEPLALEGTCLLAEPDKTSDMVHPGGAEIDSTDPYDPSAPQQYGSASCSGFIAEIENPEGRTAQDMFVSAAGWIETPRDEAVYGTEGACNNLTLEADIWGNRDASWTLLGSTVTSGQWHPDQQAGQATMSLCSLGYEVVQPGNYEQFRFVVRVSNETTTYPFYVAGH